MKIFLLRPIYDKKGHGVYQSLQPIDDVNWKFLRFDCNTKQEVWDAKLAMVQLADVAGRPGDFPSLSNQCLVVGQRALVAIGEMLEACGEMLPLSCVDGGKFSMFNPYPCYDCIDQERSEGHRFPTSGRFMWIEKFAFKAALLPKAPIFKTPTLSTHIFGTDVFKDAVTAHHLEGLEFREVWNDDGDPVETILLFDRVPRP